MVFGFAFCPVFGFAAVEVPLLALFEAAGVAGLAFDPPAVPEATGTHGIPFGFGTGAGDCPLAGMEELGCVPFCVAGPAVVCTSFPAAFVVIGVGGPIVVIC